MKKWPVSLTISVSVLAVAVGFTEPSSSNMPSGSNGTKAKVAYYGQIEKVVSDKCLTCHRPGGIGPFSLATYTEVKAKATMIKHVVDQGIMPPWFASKTKSGKSPWVNDMSLSDTEKQTLLQWIEGGMAEGDKTKALPVPKADPKWDIAKPDEVLPISKPVSVKAEGYMQYQFVTADKVFEEDKWIQAVQVRPTARGVVHHVLVFVVPSEKTEKPMERFQRRAQEGTSGYFAIYVPGNGAVTYPDGFAKRIPKGSQLEFQIHYTPNGKAVEDQTEIGLVYSKKPPLHEIRTTGLANVGIAIPPNDPNYVDSAQIRVPFDAKITSFLPHMHLRGKACKYEITGPDGKSETVLDIPKYDFNWQLRYTYADAKPVKKGSTIKFTATFDNSKNNPYNPDPNRTVPFGQQTYDEMLLGYVEYYVPGLTPGGKDPLEEASNEGTTRSVLEATFRKLDKNGDGKLTSEEFGRPAVFKLFDANGDGFITLEEAIVAVKKLDRSG